MIVYDCVFYRKNERKIRDQNERRPKDKRRNKKESEKKRVLLLLLLLEGNIIIHS